MGKLVYPGAVTIDINDRDLYHTQAVLAERCRNLESFYLLLNVNGPTIVSLWIDRSVPISFHYDDPRLPDLNYAWLEQVAAQDSRFGVTIGTEPLQ